MANAVMEAHHGLQQSVGSSSAVLAALIAAHRFNIDTPENLLFLSRNLGVSAATDTPAHASNHPPVSAAQKAILDEFGERKTPSGKFYVDLMTAAESSLTEAEKSLRTQIFNQAEVLA